MCRLLLVKYKQPTKPQAVLSAFAEMAKNSKALDGDWQGDGWGVAWLNEQNQWHRKTSLAPVWEEPQEFETIPETRTFLAHARAASFPQHKGIIEYNQPYLFEDYAFVFNGMVRGVTLTDIPGRIGAERIWFLVQKELQVHHPEKALQNIKELFVQNAKEIVALNIGLATKDGIYALNEFSRNPEYYSLHHWGDETMDVICSEPLSFFTAAKDNTLVP